MSAVQGSALSRMFARPARASVDVDALVKREAPSILNYFHRRCANPEDAADLLGETLMVAWRKRATIPEDDTRARMWLFGVARNVLNGHRRTTRRRHALTDRLGDELASAAVTVDDEVGERMRECIDQLADLDREIIRLVYWDGFTLEEVAQILQARPGTVRSRHSRARARLRAMMIDSEQGDPVNERAK